MWPTERRIMGRPLQGQRNQQVPFPSPYPPEKTMAICGNKCCVDTCYLTCLHQAPNPLLGQIRPSQCCRSPPREVQATCPPHLQTSTFCATSVPAAAGAGLIFKETTAHLVKMHPHHCWGPNTAHNRQGDPLQTTGRKEKEAKPQQQSTHNTEETLPEAPGNRGHCTARHYRTSSS